MPLEIEFTGQVVITGKKSEKSKDGSGITSEVLAMHGFIEEGAVAKLLGVATTEIKNWWFHDEDGCPRFQLVKKLPLENVYIDHAFMADGVEFTGVDLDTFELVLKKNRRAGLTFKAKVRAPTELQDALLRKFFSDGIQDLEILPEPQLDVIDAIRESEAA